MSSFWIVRQPSRTPKSGNLSAAVFAECVGDFLALTDTGFRGITSRLATIRPEPHHYTPWHPP